MIESWGLESQVSRLRDNDREDNRSDPDPQSALPEVVNDSPKRVSGPTSMASLALMRVAALPSVLSNTATSGGRDADADHTDDVGVAVAVKEGVSV